VGRVNLTAPFDGQVLEIISAEGSRVEAGAKLFRVTNPSTVWVDAELYESDLAHFGDVTSAAVGTSGDAQIFPARVLNFMTPISEETRTAKAFLELDNSDGKLRLGSFVTIYFALSSQAKGIMLPVSAVVTRSGEEVVFIQTGPESFEGRSVVTAKGPKPGTVVVTSGVKDGDRVVVSGSYQLLMKAR
jgi:membrane fusion protein, heavy metal efflux system